VSMEGAETEPPVCAKVGALTSRQAAVKRTGMLMRLRNELLLKNISGPLNRKPADVSVTEQGMIQTRNL